jgi:predicted acetyltransferase
MIGLSCVVTHPDFRHRGLGHRILKSGLDWMSRAGHHLAVLYTGAHDFYSPLGWGRIGEPMHYLSMDRVPKLGAEGYRLTQLPIPESQPHVSAIFQNSGALHPVALERTPDYWSAWPSWGADNVWFGVLDNQWTVAWQGDTPVAYAGAQRSVIEGDAASIIEACALPGHEAALFDLCDHLVARCRQEGARRLELNLPPDHPIVSRLAPAATRSTDVSAMLRVLDLPRLLAALKPELDRRAAALPQSSRLGLKSPLGSAAISLLGGEIAIDDELPSSPTAQLTPAGLGGLLLGFRSAADLHRAGEIEADGSTLELLDRLFPCLHSHYWQIDHF